MHPAQLVDAIQGLDDPGWREFVPLQRESFPIGANHAGRDPCTAKLDLDAAADLDLQLGLDECTAGARIPHPAARGAAVGANLNRRPQESPSPPPMFHIDLLLCHLPTRCHGCLTASLQSSAVRGGAISACGSRSMRRFG